MHTRTFTRKELKAMGLPDPYDHDENAPQATIVSDKITGTGRWTVDHTLTFRLPDQPENEAWRVHYRCAATEQQDERPWEYEETVEATLFRQVEKTVKVWEAAS